MNILKELESCKSIIIENRRKEKERNMIMQRYNQLYRIIPTDKQLEVIESKNKIIETTFERREGCSTAAMIKAIEYAINNQGSRVLLVSYNRMTSRIRTDEIINMLSNSNLNRHVFRTTRNPNTIEFLNGSRINIIGRNIEHFRGAAVDCLIIDGKRYLSKDELDCSICCTLHKNDTQVVILDQVDLMNGQPINI
nr:MAG TPA: Terminase [Caudoviricetes sp.]